MAQAGSLPVVPASPLNPELQMPKFGPKAVKAIFAILTLNKGDDRERVDWDRVILIFSTSVTIGLVAIYVWGKSTSRW
jgi:hypothetical protein